MAGTVFIWLDQISSTPAAGEIYDRLSIYTALIPIMEKEGCSVEITAEIMNSTQQHVFTAEPEWRDEIDS